MAILLAFFRPAQLPVMELDDLADADLSERLATPV
jgi:hypothetical protein